MEWKLNTNLAIFILLAYRRRTLYKAYEDVNSQLSREVKLGVPQYFGIYYAIGELSFLANLSCRHSSLSFICTLYRDCSP